MTPRVLLAATLEWPNAARLAIAFRDTGFVVFAVAPVGHPVHAMGTPQALSCIGRIGPSIRCDGPPKYRGRISSFLATTVL
jgi:hypothetical protein